MEKRSWHHAIATSTVAPLRFGKTRMAVSDEQNYHCMVAAIELEKYDIGHEMSNQESRHRKRHLSWITTLKLTTGVYLHAASHFGTAPDLFRILLDHCSCPSVLILAQLYAQMCRNTSTAWKNIVGTMPLQLRQWHHCDLVRPGWLYQTSKTTAAWHRT